MKTSKDLHDKSYNSRHKLSYFEFIYMKFIYFFRMMHILILKRSVNIDILDVGCGDGNFLSFLPSRIFSKSGIDFEKRNNSKDIDLYQGEYENIQFKKQFDVITAFHVIEHVDNPNKFIVKSRKLLKPGGILYIVTPNIESVGYKLAKEKWYHFDYPYHKNLFSRNKLRTILEENNLKSIYFSGEFPGFPFDFIKTLRNLGIIWLLLSPVYLVMKLFISETIVCTCKK